MSRFTSTPSTRRVFMMQVATAATAVLAVGEAAAQAMVDEKDPQAAGLAYKADASKVDKAKFPQNGSGRQLRQLRLVPSQGRCCGWRLPPVCRQTSGRQRLVLGLGQKGLMPTLAWAD